MSRPPPFAPCALITKRGVGQVPSARRGRGRELMMMMMMMLRDISRIGAADLVFELVIIINSIISVLLLECAAERHGRSTRGVRTCSMHAHARTHAAGDDDIALGPA